MRQTFRVLSAFERIVERQYFRRGQHAIMIEFRKICGKRNLRRSTRIIAYFQFIMHCLFTFVAVVKYFDNWDVIGNILKNQPQKYKHDNEYEELEYEFGVFSRLSSFVLVTVSCVYLKKATYAHNLEYIKFFMILHFADLVTSFATYIVASIRIGGVELFTIGSIVFVLNSYMLRIVYKFYKEEVITAKSLSIPISSIASNTASSYGIRYRGQGFNTLLSPFDKN